MPVRASATLHGGKQLSLAVAAAQRAAANQELRVGFFATAKYPDGTPVAYVAAIHEFGADNAGRNHEVVIPERPYFRDALETVVPQVTDHVRRRLDARTLDVGPLMDEIGLMVAEEVQDSITRLRQPENAESTILRKGSSNPLVDTGQMRASVTWTTN